MSKQAYAVLLWTIIILINVGIAIAFLGWGYYVIYNAPMSIAQTIASCGGIIILASLIIGCVTAIGFAIREEL